MDDIKPLPLPDRRVTEAQVEGYLRKRVKALGGECYKWSSPQVRGVPDRIVIFPGQRPWFVEVKAPDGKLSKLQERFFFRMSELGFRQTQILWSKEDVDQWLREEFGYE